MATVTQPFGEPLWPGTRLVNPDVLIPFAARVLGPADRSQALILALDRHWLSQPGIMLIGDVPSLPQLVESLVDWRDSQGRLLAEELDMHRMICVTNGVPFRIDPAFDWFDCDAATARAGVQLVEWIALDAHTTTLPRSLAGVASRWPRG